MPSGAEGLQRWYLWLAVAAVAAASLWYRPASVLLPAPMPAPDPAPYKDLPGGKLEAVAWRPGLVTDLVARGEPALVRGLPRAEGEWAGLAWTPAILQAHLVAVHAKVRPPPPGRDSDAPEGGEGAARDSDAPEGGEGAARDSDAPEGGEGAAVPEEQTGEETGNSGEEGRGLPWQDQWAKPVAPPPQAFRYFNSDTPWAALLNGTARRDGGPPGYWVGDLPVDEFFNRVARQQRWWQREDTSPDRPEMGPEYLYASGPAELMLPRRLVAQLGEPALLHPGQPFVRNLWVGSANVTADTHYDTSHNLFVPLYGSKHFVLQPPEAHDRLRLFPSLHPHHRQTQVPQSGSALEVTLVAGRGEALFLPAHWFHQVRSVGTSIATNVWWPSQDVRRFDAILALPVPFEQKWSRPQTALATRLFLARLLALVLPREAARTFSKRLYGSRFSSLPPRLVGADSAPYSCPGPALTAPMLYGEEPPPSPQHEDITRLREDMEGKISAVAVAFLAFSQRAVREIYLGTYVEQISLLAVDELAVGQFLNRCL